MRKNEFRSMSRALGISEPASFNDGLMKSKSGDIIKINGNIYTILSQPAKKMRSTTVTFKAVQGSKYSERFYTVTIKDINSFEKIGEVNSGELTKMVNLMNGVVQEISDHIRNKSNENMNLINWSQSRYEWGVKCQNGEEAFAGDLVNVKFSNGVFKMRIKSVAGTNDTCQIMVVDYRKGPGARGRGMDAKTILSKA